MTAHSRTRRAWPILFLVATLTILFARIASPNEALFYRDHTELFRRLIGTVAQTYATGHWPLWDITTGGGEPLAAHPTTLAYSPLLPLLWLGPTDVMYDLFVIGHYVIAVSGAYALMRVLGCNPAVSALSGLLYGISGPLISMNDQLPALSCAAFGPWAVAAAFYLTRRPRPAALALMAFATGVHALTADVLMLSCSVLLFAAIWLPEDHGDAGLMSQSAVLLVGLGLGAIIIAVQLVPFIVLITDASRVLVPQPPPPAIDAAVQAPGLFLPGWGGSLQEGLRFFEDAPSQRKLHSIYLAASTTPFLCTAFFVPRARWTALLAAGLAYLMVSPVHLHAFANTWLVGLVHNPVSTSLAYGVALGHAVSVGRVLHLVTDDLNDLTPRLRLAALPIGVALGTMLFVVSSDMAWTQGSLAWPLDVMSPYLKVASGTAVVACAISIALYVGVATRRIVARDFVVCLLVLVAGDLVLAAHPVLLTTPRINLTPRGPEYGALTERARGVLVPKVPHENPNASAEDTLRHDVSLFPPSVGWRHGVRYWFDKPKHVPRPESWYQLSRNYRRTRRATLLSSLGISHALVRKTNTAAAAVVLRTIDIDALPPIAFTTSATVVANMDQALDLAAFDSNPVNVTVEGSTLAGHLADLNFRPHPEFVLPDSVRHRPGYVYARLQAPEPGIFVVTQRLEQGWEAKVDGQPSPLVRVNGALVGTPVHRGAHVVELAYNPRSFHLGRLASAIGALIALVLLLSGWFLGPETDFY